MGQLSRCRTFGLADDSRFAAYCTQRNNIPFTSVVTGSLARREKPRMKEKKHGEEGERQDS